MGPPYGTLGPNGRGSLIGIMVLLPDAGGRTPNSPPNAGTPKLDGGTVDATNPAGDAANDDARVDDTGTAVLDQGDGDADGKPRLGSADALELGVDCGANGTEVADSWPRLLTDSAGCVSSKSTPNVDCGRMGLSPSSSSRPVQRCNMDVWRWGRSPDDVTPAVDGCGNTASLRALDGSLLRAAEDGGTDEGNSAGMSNSALAPTSDVGNTCPVNGNPGRMDRNTSSFHTTLGMLEAGSTSFDSSDAAVEGPNRAGGDSNGGDMGSFTACDARGGEIVTGVCFTGSTARIGDVSNGTVTLVDGCTGGGITTGEVSPDGGAIVFGVVFVVITTAGLVFAVVAGTEATG